MSLANHLPSGNSCDSPNGFTRASAAITPSRCRHFVKGFSDILSMYAGSKPRAWPTRYGEIINAVDAAIGRSFSSPTFPNPTARPASERCRAWRREDKRDIWPALTLRFPLRILRKSAKVAVRDSRRVRTELGNLLEGGRPRPPPRTRNGGRGRPPSNKFSSSLRTLQKPRRVVVHDYFELLWLIHRESVERRDAESPSRRDQKEEKRRDKRRSAKQLLGLPNASPLFLLSVSASRRSNQFSLMNVVSSIDAPHPAPTSVKTIESQLLSTVRISHAPFPPSHCAH